MRGKRLALLVLMALGASGRADELSTYRGSGFTVQHPTKHSRRLPPGASVAFALEYRESCFLRIETERLLQPIDLGDPTSADIFLEIKLGELRERVGDDIASHRIRRFIWGIGIELVYYRPAWNGKEHERDRVVEVLTTQGSKLFRFVYWVPEKDLEKLEPVMQGIIASFTPLPVEHPRSGSPRIAGKESHDDGAEALRAIVDAEPHRLEERFRLAVLSRRAGRPEEAIRHYLKILELDPKVSQAYYNLAVVYLEDKNEPDRAETYFRRFLELDPGSEKAEQVAAWLQTRGPSR